MPLAFAWGVDLHPPPPFRNSWICPWYSRRRPGWAGSGGGGRPNIICDLDIRFGQADVVRAMAELFVGGSPARCDVIWPFTINLPLGPSVQYLYKDTQQAVCRWEARCLPLYLVRTPERTATQTLRQVKYRRSTSFRGVTLSKVNYPAGNLRGVYYYSSVAWYRVRGADTYADLHMATWTSKVTKTLITRTARCR